MEEGNFVKQAGILAIAGIITRIIGLLYRSPLQKIIGTLGLGYYQSAYTYYTIILLISSYSIPSALSKLLSEYTSKNEMGNVYRIVKVTMLYIMIVGIISSCILFFGAELFLDKEASPVLRVLAPSVFLYGILGVLRGYFQSYGTMVQTSISQIIEQFINAVISLGAASVFVKMIPHASIKTGTKAYLILKAVRGAEGSALGTLAGVISALVLMTILYIKKVSKEAAVKESNCDLLPYKKIFIMILSIITPFILNTAMYNLSSAINTKLYTGFCLNVRRISSFQAQTNWGLFSGEAMTISNIPVAISSAMAAAIIPTIVYALICNDRKKLNTNIHIAIKYTMIVTIPCAVGMFFYPGRSLNCYFQIQRVRVFLPKTFL